ncbi:hypothetical protein [Anaplasma phagocytophilum]|uniref:hypothetical protein n=1 Tax=Anaplasma phagocytophilum TaxID=948 RepID=UPI0015DEDB5A|nr:hypothetical protein [Anaplasma phagocytophilum]
MRLGVWLCMCITPAKALIRILHNVADASRLLCCGAVLSRIVQVVLMLDSEVSGMQYMSSVACAAWVV